MLGYRGCSARRQDLQQGSHVDAAGADCIKDQISARLARIASRINALSESDVYRINEPVRVAKERQKATVLKNASASCPWATLDGGGRAKDDLCIRGEKVKSRSMSLIRWSDAAYEYQETGGKRRTGYVIGSMSSTLSGPCRIAQLTSKFTRKLV